VYDIVKMDNGIAIDPV